MLTVIINPRVKHAVHLSHDYFVLLHEIKLQAELVDVVSYGKQYKESLFLSSFLYSGYCRLTSVLINNQLLHRFTILVVEVKKKTKLYLTHCVFSSISGLF